MDHPAHGKCPCEPKHRPQPFAVSRGSGEVFIRRLARHIIQVHANDNLRHLVVDKLVGHVAVCVKFGEDRASFLSATLLDEPSW